MNQRSALLMAAGLTVFVLIVVAAAGRSIVPAATIVEEQAAPVAEATAPHALAAQSIGAPHEQEANYQALLQEANQRLQQANDQLKRAYDQQQTLANQLAVARQEGREPTQTPQVAQPQPSYPVSADQAVQVALAAAPGARLIRQPELVSFQGLVAYEVALDQGMMYIDAQSGQILDNGVAAGQTVGEGESDDESDHENDGEGDHRSHEGGEHHNGEREDEHGHDD